MKQLEINTGKETILAVELPKGVKNLRIDKFPRSGNWLIDCDSKELNAWKVKLPKGNWKPLGFADKLSEMELIDVVDERGGVYFDYENNQHIPYDFNKWVYFFFNRLDSFNSLLKANGVVTVNPCNKPNKQAEKYFKFPTKSVWESTFNKAEYEKDLSRWQQAESQLWENVFILVKI